MRLLGMTFAVAVATGLAGASHASDRIYACGDDQVREFTLTDAHAVETWRWSAADATDLSPTYRQTLLSRIDDCKPVEGGRSILVTASTGGVALIDRATGSVRFHADAPMAHSADLLPGGYVAVALSIHAEGDRLELYRLDQNDVPVQTLPLPSGHGVVWDFPRERLFAMSLDLIQSFAFDPETARLTETARWTLPGRRDGHDLSADTSGGYIVTTDDGVWHFNPDDGSFVEFEGLYPLLKVKAVSQSTDAIAWVQAEERWWAFGFSVASPNARNPRRVETPDMNLYKVRWVD